MQPLMELHPTGMVLEVFEDRVRLTPKGAIGFLTKGTTARKEIPFSSLTSVEYKPGGVLTGYIQFSIKGGNENIGWVGDAVSDENSITFGGALDGGERYNENAEKIVEFINQKISTANGGDASAQASSLADELEKLEKLHARGILSDDEFSAAKKRLIG